jgi:hypothetical protein
MRLLLLMLGITACVGGIGTRAGAQNYPWCAIYKAGSTNCGFTSFQQCLATVSEAGICMQNNTYQPPGGPRPRHRRDNPY